MKLFNSFLPTDCAAALNHKSFLCLVPRLSWQFKRRPLFVIEALTDACVLCGFEGVGKSTDACWLPELAHGKLRSPAERVWMSAYGRNASRNMEQSKLNCII